ncbi:voltage-gated potassium channel subunit beta-1 [Striga asiatica]|uniref:Voltage-gated potassium channel subunit beta-1 n=1 Tax=Striga asiatica TaxID=4170 RepID=A0A5A7PJS6_STRAF|nr:voltage-gated potassium channel subunit beta-1 [Striga asiatica]
MAVPFFNLAPDMAVSRLCLGSMTFGEQNSFPQSLQLLDRAFESGINFFDSAEMCGSTYPVPQRLETQGRSEEYLGRWIRSKKIPRDRVVLATKCRKDIGMDMKFVDMVEYDIGDVADLLLICRLPG